jgi:hypothetical protein
MPVRRRLQAKTVNRGKELLWADARAGTFQPYSANVTVDVPTDGLREAAASL